MTAPKFCESCGREASEGARFCGGCGRALGGADVPPAPHEERLPAAGAGQPEETVFELRCVAVQSFGALLLCILTLGLVWLWLLVLRSRIRYRITTERIEVAEGILTVTRRTTDLFRVQDLEIVEPFFLRMRGAGHLVVRSLDPGDPVLQLSAIPGVHAVHERLRALVAAERRRQHVRVIEEGGH